MVLKSLLEKRLKASIAEKIPQRIAKPNFINLLENYFEFPYVLLLFTPKKKRKEFRNYLKEVEDLTYFLSAINSELADFDAYHILEIKIREELHSEGTIYFSLVMPDGSSQILTELQETEARTLEKELVKLINSKNHEEVIKKKVPNGKKLLKLKNEIFPMILLSYHYDQIEGAFYHENEDVRIATPEIAENPKRFIRKSKKFIESLTKVTSKLIDELLYSEEDKINAIVTISIIKTFLL